MFEFGIRSIKYKGCELWNNLPDDIKAIRACWSFKFKIEEVIIAVIGIDAAF